MDSDTGSEQLQQGRRFVQKLANSLRSLLYLPLRYYDDSVAEHYEQERQFATDRSAIPRCTLNCVYYQFLDHNCAYSDYACICMQLTSIRTELELESCAKACPHNQDQQWTPAQILDLCDQIDTKPVLLDDMAIHAVLHRRQTIETSIITIIGTETGPITAVVTQTSTGSDPQDTTITTTSDAAETSHISTYREAPTITTVETQPATPRTTAITSEMTGAQDTSSGLSTGAKVGIGVAVPLIVILFVALLWFLRWRRMRNKPLARESEVAEYQRSVGPILGRHSVKEGMPSEIDGNPIHESGGRAIEHPLGPVYELSGQPIGSPHRLAVLPLSEGTGRSVQNIREVGPGPVGSLQGQPSGDGDVQDHDLADIRPSSGPEESGDREPATQYENMDIESLEDEIVRVRKRKERIQYLQSLEEQEESLKQAIARKKGMRV
ncbi:hypothetical protein BDV27DRAFT_160975 [Aspergillus caelatus]|uniref:CFEM domain-containing protein n=1 Tax=Aspergillus caelatus TaxID=61420 RepID=A0A5N6ZUP8_9EURO|nr:uncharacterized protein BDV27DRAFT_160975 [Aspergillus caelatus]KAE8361135.1 hypothetical protein BDV27DRAFT_160975 [Aspergillus caelatus]